MATNLEKLEVAVQSPAFLAYSQLIGAAILRAAMGDPEARTELVDLQKEQEQVLRAALDVMP